MLCSHLTSPAGTSTLPLNEAGRTAGSAPYNDNVLPEPSVPDLAFRITLMEGGAALAAVHPSWRPRVNGLPSVTSLLRPGDRVEAGGLVLTLAFQEEPARPSGGGCRPEFREALTRLCAWVAEERDLHGLLVKFMKLLLEAFHGNEAFLFILD